MSSSSAIIQLFLKLCLHVRVHDICIANLEYSRKEFVILLGFCCSGEVEFIFRGIKFSCILGSQLVPDKPLGCLIMHVKIKCHQSENLELLPFEHPFYLLSCTVVMNVTWPLSYTGSFITAIHFVINGLVPIWKNNLFSIYLSVKQFVCKLVAVTQYYLRLVFINQSFFSFTKLDL